MGSSTDGHSSRTPHWSGPNLARLFLCLGLSWPSLPPPFSVPSDWTWPQVTEYQWESLINLSKLILWPAVHKNLIEMGSEETRRKIGDSKEKDFFRSILFNIIIKKATPVFCQIVLPPHVKPSVYFRGVSCKKDVAGSQPPCQSTLKVSFNL